MTLHVVDVGAHVGAHAPAEEKIHSVAIAIAAVVVVAAVAVLYYQQSLFAGVSTGEQDLPSWLYATPQEGIDNARRSGDPEQVRRALADASPTRVQLYPGQSRRLWPGTSCDPRETPGFPVDVVREVTIREGVVTNNGSHAVELRIFWEP